MLPLPPLRSGVSVLEPSAVPVFCELSSWSPLCWRPACPNMKKLAFVMPLFLSWTQFWFHPVRTYCSVLMFPVFSPPFIPSLQMSFPSALVTRPCLTCPRPPAVQVFRACCDAFHPSGCSPGSRLLTPVNLPACLCGSGCALAVTALSPLHWSSSPMSCMGAS